METHETSMNEQNVAVKNPSAGQRRLDSKPEADSKKKFKRLLVRRIALCAIVAIAAFVVWKVKYSKTEDGGERVHIEVDYARFLNDEKIILPFFSEVYVGLRLAKAYPSGSSICFRFDAYLRAKEEKHVGAFVVGAVPRIAGGRIELGEWTFVSFDLDDASENQAEFGCTTGEAVFAMFKHKVKAGTIPIFIKAEEILQMTSAEMVVR